jgi:hypothetical protein
VRILDSVFRMTALAWKRYCAPRRHATSDGPILWFSSGALLLPRLFLSTISTLFLPLISLGLASGEFPRPAASLGLLSRFRPTICETQPNYCSGPSKKTLAGLGSGLPRAWSPREMGQGKGDSENILSISGISRGCSSSSDVRIICAPTRAIANDELLLGSSKDESGVPTDFRWPFPDCPPIPCWIQYRNRIAPTLHIVPGCAYPLDREASRDRAGDRVR